MYKKVPPKAVALQEHYPHKKFENYKFCYAHAFWLSFPASKYQLYLLHKKCLKVYMVAITALFVILKN